MSTQPLRMPNTEKAEERKKAARRSDLAYFVGAALVTVGAGMFRIRYGFLTAGAFLLLPPLLELGASFLRGMRSPMRSR